MQTLLLVEDCLELRDILSKKFKKNYQVFDASNGKQALHYIMSQKIDCIILDLEMPVMNGFEFMQKLKKNGQDIPIIVTTGRSSHDYAAKCADFGVRGYLTKPYTIKDVEERLRYLLGSQTFMNASLNTVVHPKVKEAIQFVLQNYRHQITLTGLAKDIGISPDHLSATFKKNMGISLIKFINSVRIRAAKNLLCSSDLPMFDIMEKTGFKTEPHFYTCFRKIEGITPGNFRASNTIQHKKPT